MGYGGYSSDAHRALTTRRKSLPTQQVFKSTGCHADMNPKGLVLRESRDSDKHPDSLAIMFELDVTGSMGGIPARLAKVTLPTFMETIIACGVPDPQLLFGAIGDFRDRDRSPLQMGQFESEAELMDKWLTAIHLEGRGGGHGRESYELAFYAAARHTSIDCFEKRGRRGYLFITGDENPYPTVGARDIKSLIGTDIGQDIPIKSIIAEAAKMYHPFFLVPDLRRVDDCGQVWRDLLGDGAIFMETPDDTCLVAASLVALTEGALVDLDDVGQTLERQGNDRKVVNRVIRAVEPYAASIGRGGQQRPADDGDLPRGNGRSGNRRL